MDDFKILYDSKYNPSIKSPNADYDIQLYATKDTLIDIEVYKRFIDNAISRFRHSRTYKNYKSYLMSLGMDKCQVLGNIDESMADLEMHHNFLTIFDIAILITEHVINTVGYISTFDLVNLLKLEHKNNRIPLVMLTKTVHQMYHNNEDFIIPAQYCFGYWTELLIKYNRGITLDIAKKVCNYIDKSLSEYKIGTNYTLANNLLSLRDSVKGWSEYNEYGQSIPAIGVMY